MSESMSCVIRLDNSLSEACFKRLRFLQSAFHPPWSTAQLQAQLVSDKGLNFGLLLDGQLVGFVFYQCLFEQAEILQIAIDPSYQQRGLAVRLLLSSFALIQQQKIEAVLLEVRKSNLAAIKLYKRLSFTLDGKRKGYYPSDVNGQREDALLFTKVLSAGD